MKYSYKMTAGLLGTNFSLYQFIVLVVIITALLQKKPFFKDWLPLLILWFTYDIMTTIVDIHKHINVEPIYDLELFLFGWLFGGEIPAFWAQNHQNVYLTFIFAIYYTLHTIMPLIVASTIYYKSNDRDMFKEFMIAFLITSYLAMITFALYPVAPPWYIWNEGGPYRFSQPEVLSRLPGSAAGLVEVDKLLGTSAFGSYYARFNANPYAALPSLHASYSFLCTYYVIKKYGKARAWWMIIYPAGVLVAAVYLNHHFVVDLILGIGYTLLAIKSAERISAYTKNTKGQNVMNEPSEADRDNGNSNGTIELISDEKPIEAEIGISGE